MTAGKWSRGPHSLGRVVLLLGVVTTVAAVGVLWWRVSQVAFRSGDERVRMRAVLLAQGWSTAAVREVRPVEEGLWRVHTNDGRTFRVEAELMCTESTACRMADVWCFDVREDPRPD